MIHKFVCLVISVLLVSSISACNAVDNQFDRPHLDSLSTEASSSLMESTCDDTAYTTEPVLTHSPLYIDGVDVEQVIQYFNEVCLDAEIIHSGNASLLQKWKEPVYYILNGEATDKDLEVIDSFAAWLNDIEGFPGFYDTEDPQEANLKIYFCSQQEMLLIMGESFANMDGAVTFWYENNAIFDAVICYRVDLDQHLRNSVILEEIYNGLGPIQDTTLRPDSIIYSEYSEQQGLTDMDKLILKLLYNPQLQCGMDANECERIIRMLYY